MVAVKSTVHHLSPVYTINKLMVENDECGIFDLRIRFTNAILESSDNISHTIYVLYYL